MTNTRTPEELDTISDNEFHDLAHSDTETALSLTDDQRQSMRIAYTDMVKATDADIRDNFEPAESISDWMLYATLRMNDVPHENAVAPRI